EALELRRDIVDTDGQRRQAVQAFGVARLRPREAGLRALRGDGHTGNRSALLIEDAAGDVPCRLLRERRRAGEQQDERRSQKLPSHPFPPEKTTTVRRGTSFAGGLWTKADTVSNWHARAYIFLVCTGTPGFC